MKTICNLCPVIARLCIFSIIFSLSFTAKGQNCSSTQPSAAVCSATVAENFNSNNGGFSSSQFAWSGSAWSKVDGPDGAFSYTITSSAYYKTTNNPNTVRAGFKLSFGGKISVTNVLLEIIRNSDNVVVASCSQTTGLTNGVTICIGVTSASITNAMMFKYRFTVTGSMSTGGSTAQRTTTFDDFSFAGDSNAPLPVEFSSFTANRSGNNVSLKWETQSESNNKGFEIQRKAENASDFETLAFLSSKAFGGNSSSKLSYDYNDVNVSSANSYYRIRQVDQDGRYKYTEIRIVEGVKTKSQTLVYPNPSSNGNVSIAFNSPEKRDIQLVDMAGRIIKIWKSYSEMELKLNQLKPGLYLVNILNTSNNSKEVQHIVLSQ